MNIESKILLPPRGGDMFTRRVESLLAETGIVLNGKNPWDPRINDPRVLRRIWLGGSLALGESYMDRSWEVEDLAGFMARVMRTPAVGAFYRWQPTQLLPILGGMLFNEQSRGGGMKVGREHYDIGNDLYRPMLGERMIYTCGYWAKAETLDQAQEHKLDLVARKLDLKSGERILDIGCGWGGSLIYMAEHYGVRGVGLTISVEQAALARHIIAQKGLSGRIEIRLADYKELDDEPYDAIFSLGMFEHVGAKNYRRYMRIAHQHQHRDGRFLLHTICSRQTQRSQDQWFKEYIFPNSKLPSVAQIQRAADGLFVTEDVHNFGADYAHTLRAWYDNFQNAWPALRKNYESRDGGRFFRKWEYYLLSSAGAFEARYLQLCQFVFTKEGIPGGFENVR